MGRGVKVVSQSQRHNWLFFQVGSSQMAVVGSRGFQTSVVQRDIDSAAKFIGAGAATVGVAGSGIMPQLSHFKIRCTGFKMLLIYALYIPNRDLDSRRSSWIGYGSMRSVDLVIS